MKVFQASYHYGALEAIELLIFATNESEAMGLALQSRPNTDATGWTVDELRPDEQGDSGGVAGVHYISSGGS